MMRFERFLTTVAVLLGTDVDAIRTRVEHWLVDALFSYQFDGGAWPTPSRCAKDFTT